MDAVTYGYMAASNQAQTMTRSKANAWDHHAWR